MNLARSLTASDQDWEVDFISFGAAEHSARLSPRLTLTLLATPRDTGMLDGMSWDLPARFDPVDVVHVHQPLTRSGETSILVAKALGKPLFVTDYGGRSSHLGSSLGLLDLADRVVCYSQFGTSILPTTTSPVDVVPGGVDGEFFTPGEPTEPRLHLLYAGRLLPHKGIDRVISVLPHHIRLVVCGRPYHDDYFDLLQRLAKGKDVEFVTDADDVQLRSLYRHAWATVLPSVYRDYYGTTYQQPELMGLTVLESMACGTPVIVSDVGALPEFVDHGVTGLVTSSLDTLEEAIVTLYSRRGTSLLMGLAARQQVTERYAMDNVARRIGALYDQELARVGTGAR